MLISYFFNKVLRILIIFSFIFYRIVSTNTATNVQLPKKNNSFIPRIAQSDYDPLPLVANFLSTDISYIDGQINTRQSGDGYFLAPSKPPEAFIGPAYDGITECKAVCITVLVVLVSLFCKSPVLASILMNNGTSGVFLLYNKRAWLHLARHYNH